MHFCKVCENMCYIQISSTNPNQLLYYCRNCGNEENELNVDNICISKIQTNKSNIDFSHIVNKYTKFDPTLPRINNVLCPNENCKTNMSKVEDENNEREIIYIRYDTINMKYIYLCSTCDTIWNPTEEK